VSDSKISQDNRGKDSESNLLLVPIGTSICRKTNKGGCIASGWLEKKEYSPKRATTL